MLTQEEMQVLTNLIDAAVRARGLEAAEAALHLLNKIKAMNKEYEYLKETEARYHGLLENFNEI